MMAYAQESRGLGDVYKRQGHFLAQLRGGGKRIIQVKFPNFCSGAALCDTNSSLVTFVTKP